MGEYQFKKDIQKKEEKERKRKEAAKNKKSVKESASYLATLEYFAENNIQLSSDQINSLKATLNEDYLNESINKNLVKKIGTGAAIAGASLATGAAIGSKKTKDKMKAENQRNNLARLQAAQNAKHQANKDAADKAYDRQLRNNYIKAARHRANKDFNDSGAAY